MVGEVRWLSYFVFISNILNSLCSVPHRRFEYKHSFKPPNLALKDGSVPFWEYGGNAIASSRSVRIAPSLRSQKGAMWSKSKTNFNWWEVLIIFRISGRASIGADGLAFWYTEEKGGYNGDVFGSSDKWTGLGIFFDSFDNDNKHNNPYIMGVINDGTKVFDHTSDGGSQMIVPGCTRNFRNTPFPTRALIEYYMNTLTVLFHNGLTNNDQDFELCFQAKNIYLPKEGYFGLSAATGSLADDHDVLHFLTESLYPPGSELPNQGQKVTPEEQQKISLDYTNYQRKLDQQKEEYRKEHPEAAKDDESEFDEFFESDNQRELRQIFYGQNHMFEQIRALSQKFDEIAERQERTLDLLSALQSGVALPQVAEVRGGAPTPQFIDTISRQEVDDLLNNQNSIISATRKIKNYIVEVRSRVDSILQNQGRAPAAQVGYDMASLVDELRDALNNVKQDAAADAQKLTGSPGDCSNVNCVSTRFFLVVAFMQAAAILLYNLYKSNKEAKAKKFY